MKMAIVSALLLIAVCIGVIAGSAWVGYICDEMTAFSQKLPERTSVLSEADKEAAAQLADTAYESYKKAMPLLNMLVPSSNVNSAYIALKDIKKLIFMDDDSEYVSVRSQFESYINLIGDSEKFGFRNIF